MLAAELVTLSGEPCILTTLTDITDRTRAEEALRESERRFMLIFHANPLPMTITSLQGGRLLEANDAAVRHSGYTREECSAGRSPSSVSGLRPSARRFDLRPGGPPPRFIRSL